ncbi:MAG: ATP-binding cassette domain-containing protein, partial [Pseudomonadota bacterium]|nr:ATP-binding cassette domain-containing protein [Pseudomonadota bacterium]
MLVMNNITKVFRTETVETHALKQFSLTVNEGDFVAVTGPSGSGKTTFLNIAGLLESCDEGEYTLVGRALNNLKDNQLSQQRNEKNCFIFKSLN